MTVEVLEAAPTLEELAATANREHAEAEKAAASALGHAIRAGEALLAIQSRIGRGGWHAWLEPNFDGSRALASLYMRVAYYRMHLAGHDGATLSEARQVLRGLPSVGFPSGRTIKWDKRREAQALREQGLTLDEIADLMGVSRMAVYGYLNPEKRREYALTTRRRRKAAEVALRQKERDQAVKEVAGPTSHAYAYVRKALSALEQAIANEGDREAKAALRSAMTRLHAAEDEIVHASKLSAQQQRDAA